MSPHDLRLTNDLIVRPTPCSAEDLCRQPVRGDGLHLPHFQAIQPWTAAGGNQADVDVAGPRAVNALRHAGPAIGENRKRPVNRTSRRAPTPGIMSM